MANTVIQLKWSEITAVPATLNVAEPAYSNTSNKLFIGLDGSQVIAIGGKYYTDIIEAATAVNTASTIVKRDASGNFAAGAITASLTGNADTATTAAAWTTARNLSLTGDATATLTNVNGSAAVSAALTLAASGVTAATYGSSSAIPVVTVNTKGLVTSVTTAAISSTLSTAGDTGTASVVVGTDTLTFKGADGITSNMISANTTIMMDVDNTVLRTSGGQTISGALTVGTNLTVTGNLVVSGNTITTDVETISVQDSLIELATGNIGDAIDIGFFGSFVSSASTKYTTFFRDASDSGKFKLLTNGTSAPSGANTVTVADYTRGTLDTNIIGGTVSGLSAAIAVADGGTGVTTSTGSGNTVLSTSPTFVTPILGTPASGTVTNLTGTASININGTVGATTPAAGAFTTLSATTALPVTSGGTGVTTSTGSGNTVLSTSPTFVTPILGTPASGTLTNCTGLPVAGGGTGAATFTGGSILIGSGTGAIASLANSSYTLTGTLSAAKTITSLTVDAYGRVTAATGADIAIAASQISSGTFSVSQGGTGASSFTTKGIMISHASSSTGALSTLTSATEGHILQINSSGTPTFAFLNGGVF